jgi:nicotinate-nucleotide--dimethylbenzimidazole phosphoribosyltransferase
MNLLSQTCAAIQDVDHDAARRTQKCLDEKTKPRGSLGVLESLACRLAAIYGRTEPALPDKAIIVMAADHGVVEEGISAYPAAVTEQMLANFARGGAAINVLARQVGAEVVVVNMGTRSQLDKKTKEWPGLRYSEAPATQPTDAETCLKVYNTSVGPGTASFTRGPAMTVAQALQAVHTGFNIAADLCSAGIGLIGIGEMGIGNTTAASALTAIFTGASPERVTGRGTGIDDATWKRKLAVIDKALTVNEPNRDQPLEAMAKLGGFEIAGLVGVMLGSAARKVPIVLDGFITGAAALVAVGLCPKVRHYLIASHQSVEPGHRRILEQLELRPLFNLDLRLGEGTGAALAMHLVEAALRIVREMATFASAGVSNTGA